MKSNNTQPHLSNNGGIRGHSASEEFRRTGYVRFTTFAQGDYTRPQQWIRRADGSVGRIS